MGAYRFEFYFSLIASYLMYAAGHRSEPSVLLIVTLQGYSGVAKIVAKQISSITGFWICMATLVTCFAWVIIFKVL